MSQFRTNLEGWLSRATPERGINDCFGSPIALATDVGLQRTENQDRVGALRLVSSRTTRSSLFAVAVADGMGGMRDGAKCATIALATFFSTLVQMGLPRLDELAVEALNSANEAVFAFAGGKGGSTLSAVLIDATAHAVVVHVGDSRVYSLRDRKNVERLTTDDSLAEVVGGDGRDLLQYAGMGDGIKAHVAALPNALDIVAITTDGVHFIEAKTFEQVLSHATSLRSASERLTALSRWCGGHDNASCALMDLNMAARELEASLEPSVQLWDPFGTMTTVWIKANGGVAAEDHMRQMQKVGPNVHRTENARPNRELPQKVAQAGSKSKSKSTKKSKRTKKDTQSSEDVQLEIQIDQSPESKKVE